MRRRGAILLALLPAIAVAGSGRAEPRVEPDLHARVIQLRLPPGGTPATRRILGIPPDLPGEQGMDLMRAEGALRDGDADTALRLLGGLWTAGVREPRVSGDLGEALLELHRYAQIDSMASDAKTGALAAPYLRVAAGEGLARQGKNAEALARWKETVRGVPREARLPLLETVAGFESDHAMWDEEVKTWLEARDAAGKGTAYARELGEAWLAAGKKSEAASEFVTDLIASPEDHASAEANLGTLFAEQPELRKPALDRLRDAARREPDRFDLAATLVEWDLAAGACDDALTEAMRGETVAPSGGAYLLQLAQSARGTACPDFAARAYKGMAAMAAGRKVSSAVSMGMARLLEESGEREQAMDGYLALARQSPHPPEAAEALSRAADLAALVPSRRGEALDLFAELRRDYPSSPQGREVELREPAALAVMGRADEAEKELDAFISRDSLPETDEAAARWLRARLLYFKGDLEGAGRETQEIVDRFPAQPMVNECLQMLFLLDEAPSSSGELKRIAAADYLVYRGDADGALRTLGEIAAGPDESALDAEADWRRAAIQRGAGRPQDALAALERAAKSESEPLKARALEEAGRIARDALHDPARARGYFERLLTEDPESPFADRARRELGALARPLP